MIVDVWMQHPTQRFMQHRMFESLRRWTGGEVPAGDLPVEFTLSAMDGGGVDVGMVAAWYGPDGALISNEDVAALVEAHPDRFVGVASVDLREPVPAVRELRRRLEDDGFSLDDLLGS